MYRHGDLLIKPVAALPDGAALQPRKGDLILAEGEATGHAHRIASPDVLLWEAEGQRYIEVAEPALLTHEEHHQILLAPGYYEVVRQRVYTPEEVRLVAD